MAGITSTGIGSGLDVESLVSQLVQAEAKAPTQRLNRKEANLQAELSALGSVKGALSDFRSSLSKLNDLSAFQKRSASSSDSSLFTASATSDAAEGSYGVEVSQTAQAHKIASSAFAESGTVVGTGELTFQFGTYDSGANSFSVNPDKASQTVTIDSTANTLEGVRDAVNEADIGVQATIVNDGTGARLVFASEDSGEANSLKVGVADDDGNNTDTNGLSQLAYDPTAAAGSGKNLSETVAARDAEAIIDGITVTSDTNTLSNVIDGVSITLKEADPGNTQTLDVSLNKGSVESAVNGFVESFNAAINNFNQLTDYDPETEKAGPLIGDATVRSVESQMRSLISDTVPGLDGAVRSLADIGISTQRDGTLAVDSGELSDALENNYDDVGKLFAATATASDSQVEYVRSSDSTVTGNYDLNITQMAAQGTYTGGAITNRVVDGTNDTLVVKIDGVQSGTITLAQADYTGNETELAAELQTKINGDGNLQDAGVTVGVEYDAGNDRFIVTSERYGSESTVEITTGNTDLGLNAGTGTAGVDVAGSLDGLEATGDGQVLMGRGEATGLQLRVTGGTTGDRGSVVFSRGVADRLDSLLGNYLDSDGLLDSRTDSLNNRIDDIGDEREDLQQRLDNLEERYRKEFSSLDAMMAEYQSTSDYLAQQLGALPSSSGGSLGGV